MKPGTIIRHEGKVGVVADKLPFGRVACMFGSETNRFSLLIKPSLLTPIEIIDLTPQEHEDVLHLMQALMFLLVENNEPF